MSRAKPVKFALPLIALASTVACATGDASSQLSAEEQAYQDAIAEALQPATAEEKARAERSDPITRANFWATEHQKDAANLDVTVNFMQALRDIGSHDRVIEIAAMTLPMHPNAYEVYLELGRSYMAQNKPTEAAQAFVRSADFSPTSDAAPLAALGLAFDRLENHSQAQEAYELALERDPNRVSTLSNYGLSLALTGRLEEAEAALRRAVEIPGADVRVRQNLALVLGLQGRFEDMLAVDPTAPMQSVEANQRVLREMMGASSFENLKPLNQVLDEVERLPSAAEQMPELHEADVSTEAMAEPDLMGDPNESRSTTGLRPKLRGSPGG